MITIISSIKNWKSNEENKIRDDFKQLYIMLDKEYN